MPKRQSYTVSFKLQALQYLDNEAGGNVSECAREFSVDRKRIREWSESRDRLEQQYGKKNKQKRKLSKGPAVISEHVDQGVLRYLEDERSEGRVVRNKDLKRKAMELAGAFNVDDKVLEWFPDEIGSVLPSVDGNAPGPEEPESEDDSPDDSDTDADFEGLE
ncbi:hypothetical protein ACOMHN_027771 [Nucella lapillus]